MGQVLTRLHEGDGMIVVERVQDVEPIMDLAHDLRVSGQVGSSDMKLAASLPMVLVEQYCNDNGVTFEQFMDDPVHVNTMLNDPALKAFRVWEGRV